MLKRNLSKTLRVVLAAILAVAALPAHTEAPVVQSQPQLADVVLSLESLDQEVVEQKARQEKAAPSWLKRLLNKKVGSYFRPTSAQNPVLEPQSLNQLVDDSERVVRALEENDSTNEYRDLVKNDIEPYLRSLQSQQLVFSLRKVTGSVAGWTLESLVVSRMLELCKRSGNFPQKALDLLKRQHLKGISKKAGYLVLLGVVYWAFPQSSWETLAFMAATIWFAFKAGPIGTILNSASGWFVRPTSEQFKVMESRYTYKWEEFLNGVFDRLNPKTDLTAPVPEEIDRNDRLKIATIETDGTDFAGMTPEDQVANWDEGKNIFVSVAKRFGQLLRETHHGGRDLMMLSWTDQQNIATMVEILDSKRIVLRSETLAVLNPHNTAFLMKGEIQKKAALEKALEEFENHCDQIWQNPEESQQRADAVAAEIDQAREKLRTFGLSDSDLNRLTAIQKERARAIGTLITSLAIGEMRAFYQAERNRNLAPSARKIERGIRAGLAMQQYLDRYLPQVQRGLRSMGLQVSGRSAGPNLTPEQCLIVELRMAYHMKPVTITSSEKCQLLLFGRPEQPRFDVSGRDNPLAQFLGQFKDIAKRNEAISVINEAAVTQPSPKLLQSGVRTAIEKCLN